MNSLLKSNLLKTTGLVVLLGGALPIASAGGSESISGRWDAVLLDNGPAVPFRLGVAILQQPAKPQGSLAMLLRRRASRTGPSGAPARRVGHTASPGGTLPPAG